MESIRESAQQLQHLFETDVPQQEQPAVKRRAGKSQ